MKIANYDVGDAVIVRFDGRLDTSTATDALAHFDALVDDGRELIIADFSSVDFVSSAGLRVMIDVQKTCKRWNRGEMVLASVPQRIYEAMDLAGLLPLFKLFDDATEAVGSF